MDGKCIFCVFSATTVPEVCMSSEHDGKDQDDLFSPLPYLLVSGAVVLMTLLLRCLFCPGEQL